MLCWEGPPSPRSGLHSSPEPLLWVIILSPDTSTQPSRPSSNPASSRKPSRRSPLPLTSFYPHCLCPSCVFLVLPHGLSLKETPTKALCGQAWVSFALTLIWPSVPQQRLVDWLLEPHRKESGEGCWPCRDWEVRHLQWQIPGISKLRAIFNSRSVLV